MVAQANVQAKPDRYYNLLIAVNGTAVYVQIDAAQSFQHVFAARMIDGEPVGLNKGLIGVGSQNATGKFDNIVVQVLPPQITLETEENFDDGVADLFTGPRAGSWAIIGARYENTTPNGTVAYSALDLGRGINANAWVEVTTSLRIAAGGAAGLLFDHYGERDFKFVTLDLAAQQVRFGHMEPRAGYVVEKVFARTLTAERNYVVQVTLKGASVTIMIDGAFIGTWGYNSSVTDGAIGTFNRAGRASFDNFRLRTNDPAFESPSVSSRSHASEPEASHAQAMTLQAPASEQIEPESDGAKMIEPDSGSAGVEAVREEAGALVGEASEKALRKARKLKRKAMKRARGQERAHTRSAKRAHALALERAQRAVRN